MSDQKPSQDINMTVNGNAAITGAAIGNENQVMAEVKAGGHVIQAKYSTVTLTGDIITGNKTIINNIIQQAAKQIITAPYKFLASYDISDHDIFFGRDAVIEQLVGKLPRFKTLVINGRSGSGKTSLINAGLIPRLAENGYQYLSFRDYSDPLRQLREHVAQDDVLKPFAGQTTSLPQFLRTVTRQQQQHFVVIFDQFERFFVNVPAAVRMQFIQEIKACLDSDLSGEELDLVFAMREDFFGAFVIEFETQIPTFFNQTDRFNLLPLNRDEAREAILRPLKKIPLHIGYHLPFVDEVLLPGLMGESAAGSAIDPPHLQIVCNQLYQAARERSAADLEQGGVAQIDRQLYQELGETSGILRTYLDDFIDRAAHRDSGGRDVLRSMLKLMLDTTGTRKFVSFADLKTGLPDVQSPAIEQHIREFQDGRIIETRGTGEAARYSLSHEVMVAKVQSWFDERELERKKAQETIERGLIEWQSSQSLLNEKQVAHIRQWLSSETLNAEAAQLLQTSQRAYEQAAQEKIERERKLREEEDARRKAEQEYAEEQRKRADDAEKHAAVQSRSVSRIKKLAVGLVVFLIVALVAAVVAWQKQQEAKRNAQAAQEQTDIAKQETKRAEEQKNKALKTQSLFLADLARQQNERQNYGDALLLALEALPQNMAQPDRPYVPEAEAQLYTAAMNVREQKTLLGHADRVTLATFSPDGILIVTASQDRTARVWEAATGKEVVTLTGHEGTVTSAAFSPDGTRIVTASFLDKTARVWEAATGREVTTLTGHEGTVTSAAFSPNGTRIVTASVDNTARVWDAATGQELATLAGHTQLVWSAAFSPDGTRIVTAAGNAEGDTTARVWDVSTTLNTGAITVKEVATLTGHTAAVTSAAFSPDGARIVTASADQTARVWDAATGQELATLTGHTAAVTSAAFSPDGTRIVTTSFFFDQTAQVWDAATGVALATLTGHTDSVNSAVFSPDGTRIVTASSDNTVRVWDTATGQKLTMLTGHTDSVNSAAFSPDGTRIVTASTDQTARIWDVATGKGIVYEHERQVTSAAFSPDGTRIVTASADQTARVWEAATGKELATLTDHTDDVWSAAFSPNGERIVTASADKTVRVWNAATGQELATLTGHTKTVFSAAFSPDGGRIVTVSGDGTARVWDVVTGKELVTLSASASYVTSATFSPDGKHIVMASNDQTARVWDAVTGQELATLTGHSNYVVSAAFSPDGTRIVTASDDNTARVWDVATGNELATLTGHTGNVRSAVFSPGGTRIVTASDDTTARVWDAATGKEVARLTGHEGGVTSAVFSPDGTRIVTASLDGTARVWRVFRTTQELIDYANAIVPRRLTPEERKQYFLE